MQCRAFRSSIGHYSLDDGSMTTKKCLQKLSGDKIAFL